jgi:hypothetical protein
MRQCGRILDKNIRGMVLYFLSLLQLHPMQQLNYLTFNAGSYVAYDSLIGDYVTFGCVIETFKLKIFSIFNNAIMVSIIQGKLERPLIIVRGENVGIDAIVTKNVP